MYVSNPAAKSQFFNLLPIRSMRLRLDRQVQINNLKGGDILQSELVPPMWIGSVELSPMPKRKAAEVQAILAILEAPGQKFEAYKAHQIGPEKDPLGEAIGPASPKLLALGSTRSDRVKFSNLPEGYELSAGDFVSFDYDPGTGVRRAFHQINHGRVHDQPDEAGGFTSSHFCHVVPPIRAGAAIGGPVEFVKPCFLAVLVPGSVSEGTTQGNVTSGIRFDFRQTLRA